MDAMRHIDQINEEVIFDPEEPYIKEFDEFKDDPFIFE